MALAGPVSLDVITQVASSLVGQLRMMAGQPRAGAPALFQFDRLTNVAGSAFGSHWQLIIQVSHATPRCRPSPSRAAQTVLKSAEASLVRVLNEWLLLLRKNDELAEGWLEEVSAFAREISRSLPRLTLPQLLPQLRSSGLDPQQRIAQWAGACLHARYVTLLPRLPSLSTAPPSSSPP